MANSERRDGALSIPVHLVRHTSVAVGPSVCYGNSDVSLAESWPIEFQAVDLKLRPSSLGSPQLYTSPLRRCSDLAGYLEARGLPRATPDPRLKEMDFGRWELTPWTALPHGELTAWKSNLVSNPAPDGESFAQVALRASAFLKDLLPTLPPDGAVIVSHGGVIRAMLAFALGCRLDEALKLQVDYGGITLMEFGITQHRVRYVNR